MSEELLPYYHRELAYFRALSQEFASEYPKVAGRLRLGPEHSDDPHVARLIEAFALIAARIRHKLDDDLPELSDGLLNVLYPHYLAPIPSMSICRFELDVTQAELVEGFTIPAHSMLETEPIGGLPCRFRTAYPVQLWPIEVAQARLAGLPILAPRTPWMNDTKAVLTLSLDRLAKQGSWGELGLESIRLHLDGETRASFRLLDLLQTELLGIALGRSPDDPNPVLLDADRLGMVGYAADEGLLPYSPRSFVGYRLLTEFFAFPEKFLFIDLLGLTPEIRRRFDARLQVFFYLKRSIAELERSVAATSFRLGATPIVNLFPHRAEPIHWNHAEHRYRIVPDARRPQAVEIFSVDRVLAHGSQGKRAEFHPYFSFKHGSTARDQRRFYLATREESRRGARVEGGTDVYLTLVDLDFQPLRPGSNQDASGAAGGGGSGGMGSPRGDTEDWMIDVEATCLNRDLPSRLPFGPGQPRLELALGGPWSRIVCLRPFTPTRRPPLRDRARWRLVSHLLLSHLSISDGAVGADALREILALYADLRQEETSMILAAITGVSSRRVVGPSVEPGVHGFTRGVEIRLDMDETPLAGSTVGAVALAGVLERFLGLYTTINSFTRLVLVTKQRGVVKRWPARAGEQTLI